MILQTKNADSLRVMDCLPSDCIFSSSARPRIKTKDSKSHAPPAEPRSVRFIPVRASAPEYAIRNIHFQWQPWRRLAACLFPLEKGPVHGGLHRWRTVG